MDLPICKTRGTIAATVQADEVADVARRMTDKGFVFVEVDGIGTPSGFKEPKHGKGTVRLDMVTISELLKSAGVELHYEAASRTSAPTLVNGVVSYKPIGPWNQGQAPTNFVMTLYGWATTKTRSVSTPAESRLRMFGSVIGSRKR